MVSERGQRVLRTEPGQAGYSEFSLVAEQEMRQLKREGAVEYRLPAFLPCLYFLISRNVSK